MKRFILIIVILLLGVTIYYFVPKTLKSCSSTTPQQCREYRCERGFIYKEKPIGGLRANCFLGPEPSLDITSV